MFDAKALEIIDQADFPLPDAAGNTQQDADGNDLSITFASPGTKKYMQAKHIFDEKQSNGVVARMSGKSNNRTYLDDINDKAEFFANITISLNGFEYGDKKGYEGYKALYANPKLGFIVAGADKFVANWGNFKPGSVTISPSA